VSMIRITGPNKIDPMRTWLSKIFKMLRMLRIPFSLFADVIAKCDWECSARSDITNDTTYAKVTLGHLKVDEFCGFIRNMYVASCFH